MPTMVSLNLKGWGIRASNGWEAEGGIISDELVREGCQEEEEDYVCRAARTERWTTCF